MVGAHHKVISGGSKVSYDSEAVAIDKFTMWCEGDPHKTGTAAGPRFHIKFCAAYKWTRLSLIDRCQKRHCKGCSRHIVTAQRSSSGPTQSRHKTNANTALATSKSFVGHR